MHIVTKQQDQIGILKGNREKESFNIVRANFKLRIASEVEVIILYFAISAITICNHYNLLCSLLQPLY